MTLYKRLKRMIYKPTKPVKVLSYSRCLDDNSPTRSRY